jgi:hypothetical protein
MERVEPDERRGVEIEAELVELSLAFYETPITGCRAVTRAEGVEAGNPAAGRSDRLREREHPFGFLGQGNLNRLNTAVDLVACHEDRDRDAARPVVVPPAPSPSPLDSGAARGSGAREPDDERPESRA